MTSITRPVASLCLAGLFSFGGGGSGGSGGSGGGGVLPAHGAPYHSYHAHRHHHRRPRNNGPPRPTRFGYSPNFAIYEEEGPSSTYFERNGVSPPPLIARDGRRRTQVFDVEPGEAMQAAAAAGDGDDTTNNELESIIQEAKYGEDGNARLRHDLLWGHNGFDRYYYDKHSYPWAYIWYNQTGKRSGVPVEMNINFHRVFSVDIVDSVLDLVVWLRWVWVDPRLTWKPEEYGNLNTTWFWIGDGGAGGETSEIWTPDIELWNLETGLMGSLEDTYARVSYDGTVWWSRPGHLRPTCKFAGLNTFPFDRLTCTMEFGSWMRSGKYISVEKHGGVGYSMGGSETAGESYAEYSFVEEDPITVDRHVYTYQSAPEDDWPVLMYNVTLARSWQPYARGYIATQVVLNAVGFSAFWLPPSCGERMSLSITAMLAALAAEIVVAAYLPACAEITWFSKFSIVSMVFAFVSLMESVMVLYFYYKRSEDMVPKWYAFTKSWYLVRQAKRRGEDIKKFSSEVADRTTTLVTESANTAVDVLHNATDSIVSGAKEVARRSSNGDDADADDTVSNDQNTALDNAVDDTVKASNNAKGPPSVRFMNVSDYSLGSAGELRSPRHRNSIAYSTTAPLQVPKNADDFHNEQELENNRKWKLVAARIDDVSRFWIPLAYIISLSIIMAEVF